MVLAILAAWFGYKKAKETGRNGILWAFICAGTFIGTQLLCTLVIGTFIGIGIAFFGWSEKIYDDYSPLITVICIIASIGSLFLLFRHLDKIPEEEIAVSPPPPPTFESKD